MSGQRGNISAELRGALGERILSGALGAGLRLNEVHLARELGVSRTPLREALTQLVADGLLESVPRRGYFVPELSVDEVRALYPIRAFLDPEALRMSGLPDADELEALRRLNDQLAAVSPRNPARRIDLDDRWHRRLIARCGNPVLLEMIEQLIRRTRRYEFAYLREQAHVEVATGEHEAILDALAAGDLERACVRLRQNMESAREPLLEWLERRPSTP